MTNVMMQVAAKALIVNDEGKVLILREPAKNNVGSQDGLYGVPGGRMDAGETYEQALHREVFEEAGLEVDILYPIYIGEWTPTIKGQKCHIVAIFSVCKAKTTDVKLSIEHDDYKWILPKDVGNYDLMDVEPAVIKRYAQWLSDEPSS